jgi:hypothetical protein
MDMKRKKNNVEYEGGEQKVKPLSAHALHFLTNFLFSHHESESKQPGKSWSLLCVSTSVDEKMCKIHAGKNAV